jgi:membrane associated rhomboid family serine protease
MIMAIAMFVSFYLTSHHYISRLDYALVPRSISHWIGIITHPFMHTTEIHLYGNLCMFFVLSTMITVTRVNSHLIIILLYTVTAGMLWLCCDSDKYLMGISAFCFAEAGFLFVSAFIERTWWSLFVSITSLSLYGFTVWNGTFNAKTGVSALGHTIGFLCGLIVATILYKKCRNTMLNFT